METVTNSYRRLFEVRLMHHYWLDDGATIFDLIADQDRRTGRLLTYDVRRLLAMAPTASTAAAIAGFGGVCKETGLGMVVAVPPGASIPADTTLEFAVTVRDSDFFNYTALTLRPRRIYEIFYQPEKKVYRYKENVPLLSNLTGAFRNLGAKTLFLSQEFPPLAAGDPVESLVASLPALEQLTSDQPGAAVRQIAPDVSAVPVFLNQADIPAIVPPPGLTGAPPQGVLLGDELPDDLFALVRLTAVRTGDQDFSFVDNAGHPKADHPVFEVRLKNRSTTWKYLNKNTGAVISQSAAPLPLTFFGNAGTGRKPSAGVVKPAFSANRITDLVSEIFI
ncbi:hypothetical protein GMSM_18050 [Geomonas sp. Red276]